MFNIFTKMNDFFVLICNFFIFGKKTNYVMGDEESDLESYEFSEYNNLNEHD